MMPEWYQQGGPVMHLLLVCSLVAVAVILERLVFWWRERVRLNRSEIDEFFDVIHDGELQRAREKAVNATNPMLQSMVRALGHSRDPRMHALHEALELEIDKAYERTRSYLKILDTIVSLAPLLGIFGTVIGIIQSFHAISLSATPDPQVVGAGLSQALITTASGLGVAMPSLIFHNLFQSWSQRHVSWLEKYHREFEIHSDELTSDNGTSGAES